MSRYENSTAGTWTADERPTPAEVYAMLDPDWVGPCDGSCGYEQCGR